MRFLKTPSPATVIATAALAVAVGGVAAAAIPGPDGVIHACVTKAGIIGAGVPRLLDQGQKCYGTENPVDWNQQGQKGADGTNGTNGTNGVSGVSGYEVVKTRKETQDTTVASGANCPSGKKALGGGVTTDFGDPGDDAGQFAPVRMVDNSPSSGTSWIAAVVFDAAPPAGKVNKLIVEVICANVGG